jgi:hypothetical protein
MSQGGVYSLYSSPHITRDKIKKKIGSACGKHGEKEWSV